MINKASFVHRVTGWHRRGRESRYLAEHSGLGSGALRCFHGAAPARLRARTAQSETVLLEILESLDAWTVSMIRGFVWLGFHDACYSCEQATKELRDMGRCAYI